MNLKPAQPKFKPPANALAAGSITVPKSKMAPSVAIPRMRVPDPKDKFKIQRYKGANE